MPDITSNMLAWWRLDDGAGATCADSSGNSRTGSLVGPPTWVTGKIGPYALSFDGSDYVDSSNFADNLIGFTVAAWFKTTTSPDGFGDCIVSKLATPGISSGQGWCIKIGGPSDNANNLSFFIQKASSSFAVWLAGTSFVDGQWHHAAMTVTAGPTVNAYVDGVFRGSDTNAGVTTFSNANNVRIGGDYDSELFNGQIDEVRLYSRALSAADILALYNFAFSSGVLMGQGAM